MKTEINGHIFESISNLDSIKEIMEQNYDGTSNIGKKKTKEEAKHIISNHTEFKEIKFKNKIFEIRIKSIEHKKSYEEVVITVEIKNPDKSLEETHSNVYLYQIAQNGGVDKVFNLLFDTLKSQVLDKMKTWCIEEEKQKAKEALIKKLIDLEITTESLALEEL